MKNSKVDGSDDEPKKVTKKKHETPTTEQRKNVEGSLLASFIRGQWINNNPDYMLIRKVNDCFCVATLPYSPFARMSEAVKAYLVAISKVNALDVIHTTLGELKDLDAEGAFSHNRDSNALHHDDLEPQTKKVN